MKSLLKDFDPGFTLIELGFVLIVIGLILFMSSGAWTVLIEGRKISATKSSLKTSNNCLLNYTSLSKRIPSSFFYKKNCIGTDAWGNSLYFFSIAQSQEINCNNPLKKIKDLKGSDNEIRPSIVWILVSAGPNKKLDLISLPKLWDLSKGDDLYVFVTDMELHQEVCN